MYFDYPSRLDDLPNVRGRNLACHHVYQPRYIAASPRLARHGRASAFQRMRFLKGLLVSLRLASSSKSSLRLKSLNQNKERLYEH